MTDSVKPHNTIRLYDAAGNVVATAQTKSTHKRLSVRAGQWQRQIDSMYVPGAVRATIHHNHGGETHFDFRGTFTQYAGFKPSPDAKFV